MADVAHADDGAGGGRFCGAGDEADFGFAFRATFRVCCEKRLAGIRNRAACEAKQHALALNVAARTNPLDDFLSRVAALRKIDVCFFERRLMRDLILVEIHAVPRDSRFEAQNIQRGIANRAAAVPLRGFEKQIPEGM